MNTKTYIKVGDKKTDFQEGTYFEAHQLKSWMDKFEKELIHEEWTTFEFLPQYKFKNLRINIFQLVNTETFTPEQVFSFTCDAFIFDEAGDDRKILNEWRDSGLLETTPQDVVLFAAKLLENISKIIKNRNQKPLYFWQHSMDCVYFPISIRVVKSIFKDERKSKYSSKEMIKKLTADFIVSEIDDLFLKTYELYTALFKGFETKLDIELEVSVLICDLIAQKWILKCNQEYENSQKN